MRQMHVTVTWQSDHLVEVEGPEDLTRLVEVLSSQPNVRMVGYTAQPLDEVIDLAVERLLDPGSTADDS